MDELPAPREVTKPKRMRRTKPPGKRAAAMLPPAALASTQTGCDTPVLSRPQATPEPIPVPDDFDETMQAINYHFDDTARPPLDLDPNSDLNSDLDGKASSTFGLQSAWSEDEGVGVFGFGPSEGSYVTDPSSGLAHHKQSPRTSGTQLDVRPRAMYRGPEFEIILSLYPAFKWIHINFTFIDCHDCQYVPSNVRDYPKSCVRVVCTATT
jgi:hypothetical protein